MISRGIDDPVGGEHALAIVPAEARSVAAGLRRARFYAGRSVNDIAFLAEQTYRERLLALYGRTLTPGLISGLGARLGDDGLLGVDAGLAVSAQGVLVRLAAGTAVTWAELPVVGAGEGGGGAAGLLVLQPTWVEDAGDADPSDPCPRDPSADAFERWSRVDAGRLVRVPWPDAVPGGLVPAAVAEALAWEVFEAERSLAERELLPWERYGIPLALVITSASDQVLHVAPWAVARRGGGARRTSALVDGRGRPSLWQARVDWFVDQLVQRVEAEGYVETDRSLATRWFTRLPPVGALPADFLEPRRLNSDGYPSPIDRFFPAHIRPIVEPVPASQVDALMAAAAPLDPIDLSRDAAVGVSVVVPDDLYEPELLVLEQVAPEFYQMLSAFDLRLQDILWRRTQLRDMLRALQAAADGLDDVTVFADPDPDAVTGERVGFGPIAVDPSAPYIEVRDPNDPRYFIESIRAAGTLDGLDWGTLFSILVGPNAQRWVRVLTDAALAAEGMRERRIVLRVGTTDRVDLALTVPARPAARWMINDKVLNRVDRPTSRFELRPAVEGWDSSLSTTWQERDPGSSMVVIAAKLDDDALRNLQALPYTDRSDAARGPVAVLPPLDEPDPDRWYSKLNPEAFSLDRPLLVQPDALIVLPSERDESSKGIRMVPDANLTTVELGGLSGPEDPLFCDLSFAVDVVNQLLADPYAAFQDDALWWRVCSRVTGAEAECETALCEGGRVAADFKAMQLRLAQSDSGLGPDDVTLLTKLGLRPWIEVMQERIRRAESSLTLSFTRCQAGIYAARQLVLGAEAATRTTTSPVLATIGLGTTETATKQESTTFAAYVAPAATRGLTNGGKLTLGLEQAPPEAPAVRAAREKLAKAGFDSNAKILRSRSAAATLGRARALAARAPAAAATGDAVPMASITLADSVRGISAPTFSYLPPKPIVPFSGASSTSTQEAVAAFNTPATVGVQYEYGQTGIAERVVEPIAYSVLDRAKTVRAEVTDTVSNSDLYLDDVGFSGFFRSYYFQGQGDVSPTPAESVQDFYGIRFIGQDRVVGHSIIAGTYDVDLDFSATDEANYVQAAIRHLEHGFQTVRLAESRLVRLKRAVDLANKILPSIDACSAAVLDRLQALEEQLAEARHDFTVATALLQEETLRVAEVNARRDRVIAEHVQNLLFHHLRSDAWLPSPEEQLLDPVLLRQVVPECIATPSEPPEELRQLLDVWREAPAAWFPLVKKNLSLIGKLGTSRSLLQLAVERKAAPARALSVQPAKQNNAVAAPLLLAMQSLQNGIAAFHQSAAKVDTGRLQVMPWLETQQTAEAVLTLGDLLEGDGVSSVVRQSALEEVEHIGRVATCLYDAMGDVPAILRLGWVTRLSQFDVAFDLRRLSVLPQWSQVPVLLRQTLQAHTDWLYGRVDAAKPEAVALVRDLVRVCILLASHAPVDEVIAGTVTKAVTVRPGVRVPVRLDPSRVRVGMSVTLFQANNAVGKAVVEDLDDGGATVAVVQAYQEVTLTTSDKVHVVEPTTGAARKIAYQPKVTNGATWSLLGGE